MQLVSNNSSRDPDDALVATFKHHTVENPIRTALAGRPMFDDIEVVEIRAPGSRNFSVHPAAAVWTWVSEGYGGDQRQITYAERFAKQYQQFKSKVQQTKSGTPLDHVPFLTPARCAELRAQNIYTVEQLAAIDGQELKNLGTGGRDQKNSAAEYIAEMKAAAPETTMLAAELEALKARAAILEEDNAALKQRAASAEAQFEEMTETQLRAYIKSHTGHEPQGNLPVKSLVMLAMGARPTKAA